MEIKGSRLTCDSTKKTDISTKHKSKIWTLYSMELLVHPHINIKK